MERAGCSQVLMSRNWKTVSHISGTSCAKILKFHAVRAKALYPYEGGSPDELPFAEGDVLAIVDRSESDWWKTEKGGVIFIVPAAYLEVIDG